MSGIASFPGLPARRDREVRARQGAVGFRKEVGNSRGIRDGKASGPGAGNGLNRCARSRYFLERLFVPTTLAPKVRLEKMSATAKPVHEIVDVCDVGAKHIQRFGDPAF